MLQTTLFVVCGVLLATAGLLAVSGCALGVTLRLAVPGFLLLFGLAVEPKARGDEQKISGSLQKIADEDPTFKITRDPQTKEMVINGMSQLHLDVIQSRLRKRFERDPADPKHFLTVWGVGYRFLIEEERP